MKYADLHCDTVSVLKKEELLSANRQVNLNKLLEVGCTIQCFAMFVNLEKTSAPYAKVLELIKRYYMELSKNTAYIAPLFFYHDYFKNSQLNKISAMLTVEEGGVLEGKISNLEELYNLGVRMLTLTWNYSNELGHSSALPIGGLTDFGIEVVKRMNDLGMIVDVSHLSDRGFFDVLRVCEKPVVASHSNARSICDHKRNLTDEMILALNASGGVMGINFYPQFLNSDYVDNSSLIDDIVKHICHIKKLCGVDVVAIGSDFDGIEVDFDCHIIPKLFGELHKVGFSEEELEKIAYKNFLRVIKACLK